MLEIFKVTDTVQYISKLAGLVRVGYVAHDPKYPENHFKKVSWSDYYLTNLSVIGSHGCVAYDGLDLYFYFGTYITILDNIVIGPILAYKPENPSN